MSALRIAGAGLAGLLAGHAWPTAAVFEAEKEPRAQHRALLRFRSQDVANLVGMEFQPVTVRKAIWFERQFVQPNVLLANLYSQKILGRIAGDRSIWNVEPVQRFIAPETLYDQLVDNIKTRISWGAPCDYADRISPIISTAPLPVVLQALKVNIMVELQRASIHVRRFRVPQCNVYQTVYFPDPELSVYRASITGDLLIIENRISFKEEYDEQFEKEIVLHAFGIEQADLLDSVHQKYGKIVPLHDGERRALLHRLTSEYGVFSLGRFATWRNVLLDDVVQDIAVVRRLLRASKYEQALHSVT